MSPAAQDDLVRVARIGKPHGIRGEVTVQVFTDDPDARFAPGERLVVRDGAPGPWAATCSSASAHGSGFITMPAPPP